MQKLLRNVILSLSILLGLTQAPPVWGNEDPLEAPVVNPFALPQTNLYLGSYSYVTQIGHDPQLLHLDEGGISLVGFDLEVNYSRFMNIGAFIRFENQTRNDNLRQFSTLLGGFTRFFYIPPFLRGQSSATNLFIRFDLGAGPTFLPDNQAIVSYGGALIGAETYFNRWIGVGLSFGKIFQYGVQIEKNKSNVTVWSHGNIFLASFKTTFF